MKNSGFTLVEMLVVIGILGLFIYLVPGAYRFALHSANNSQTKNDLKQYKIALESYALNNGTLYPLVTQAGATASGSLCPLISSFITHCLENKFATRDTTYTYYYLSSNDMTRFVLWGKTDSGKHWVLCSNNKTQEYSIDTVVVNNGTCPLP